MAPSSSHPAAPDPGGTVDPAEISRFEALADQWWDPDGRFRPLHRFNPERLRFVRDHAARRFGRDGSSERPLAGLSVLDIGTGGGLVAEPMARLGAAVTGIDPSDKNIAVAATHARRMGLAIDYRATTAEALAALGARFDIVLAMEVIEHVADVGAFVEALAALVAPGGLCVVATLNRTLKSYALAIIGAEYVMRWLPVGTHDWNKFLTPDELARLLAAAGLRHAETKGLVYNPFSGRWRLDRDTGVNYLICAEKD